jgi:hypothetical protein
MSNLKRKPAAGGYQDSSDLDEEELFTQIPLGQSDNKKARLGPYVSSRPTVLSKGATSGFLYPRSSISARGSMPPSFTASSFQHVTTTPEPASSQSATSATVLGSRFPTPLQFPSEGKYDYIQITLLD